MKIILLIALFIFSIESYTQEQPYEYNVEVLYNMISQPDSTNKYSKSSEIMTLLIGDRQSLFASRRYMAMDSAMTSELNKGNSFGPPMRFYEEKGTKTTMAIFKTDSNVFYYGKPAPYIEIVYNYSEFKPLMNWEIKNDTTIISGIVLQKATTSFGGRQWTAWFAPSVAVSEGPYKFSGLPGLIFKIHDKKKYWIFELMTIRNVRKVLDLNFNNIEPVRIDSKKSFFEEKKHFMENRMQIMKLNGWSFSNPMGTRKRYEKEAKADNNWIEILDVD